MGKDWKDMREDVERLARMYGIVNFARKVPASPSTVYQWLNGEVKEPKRAQRAAVERLLRESSSGSGDTDDSQG